MDAPFARWSKEQVCDWLQEQGLGLYVNMARGWISSGQTLLQASQHDLERVSCHRSFKKSPDRVSLLPNLLCSTSGMLRVILTHLLVGI